MDAKCHSPAISRFSTPDAIKRILFAVDTLGSIQIGIKLAGASVQCNQFACGEYDALFFSGVLASQECAGRTNTLDVLVSIDLVAKLRCLAFIKWA